MKRNRMLYLLKTLVCIGLLMTCMLMSVPAFAEKGDKKVYKWRMQSLLPASLISDEQYFADLVNLLSDGEIKITIFADGGLVPFPEMFDAVSKNVVQMVNTLPAAYDKLEGGPFYSDMPFAWQSMADAMSLIYDYQDGKLLKLAREECAKYGVYYIGPIFADRSVIISTKPLKTVEDVKGLQCQTFGISASTFMKEIGGVGMFIPAEELYMALTNNIANAALFGGALTYAEMGLGEVAKYYNQPSLTYPVAAGYMINLKLWESLPKRLQALLETAAQRESNYVVSKYNELEYESRRKLQKQGVEMVQMSPELVEHMKQGAYRTMEKLSERGPVAREMYQVYKDWLELTGN